MIELSQWRASIGLWNCCCSGMKLRNKSSSLGTTKQDADKGLQQSFPPHFLIVICLLLNLIFTIGSTAHCYCSKVQCSNLVVTAMKSIATITSGLCFGLKIFFCSLLLLSGDIELNPGPVIDERPDIAVLLDLLEPLENWQLFGRQLPGITQQIIDMIKQSEMSSRQQKNALFEEWFEQNPKATWKDVLAALKRKKETKLIKNIEDHLASICDLVKPKDNHDSDDPKKILRSFSDKITAAITNNLDRISDALFANGLITFEIKIDIISTTGISDYKKASLLVTTLLGQMDASLSPKKDLINICHILINQNHQTLTDIAKSILNQLGQPYRAANSSDLPDDVQEYIKSLKDKYLSQPIIAKDWPPRVGKDFFGRLALVMENELASKEEHLSYSRCMLMGDIDKIPHIHSYKVVTVETMLNSDLSSLRVAIDGPPGIGKTTLCRKLLKMWSKGSHELQHYDLVLYCPFRHKQVAEATELADIFTRTYKSPKVSKVVEWITEREGKGLLIIFDGWDELSTQLQKSSLATSIICKDQLVYSSVIVTSRTYATASLLQLECLDQNIHVIGFFADEINKVIKGRLGQGLAEKLIQDLRLRDDVLSLCYVPLVCSMVILVYRKFGGHLPATVSELYENFILQTIRRHVNNTSNEQLNLESLNKLPSGLNATLQQMCEFAYFSLKEQTDKMTFTRSQLQSLDIATKENYLGLITTITDFDEEWYQFIHLSIQEFLAAWWIAKSGETEEIFKNCFDDDHFRLCLRFVAGISKLQHRSYQQYFNSTEFDLQCKKIPLLEIESSHSWHTPDNNHIQFHDFPYNSTTRIKFLTLLHLLYESQNTELCQVLAQSIKNYSICLGNILIVNREWLDPPFDTLCIAYFIHNSNTTWKYLHFDKNEMALNMINKETQKNTAQCSAVVIENRLKSEVLQWSLPLSHYLSVKEFYFTINFEKLIKFFDLIIFLELPQLLKLHLNAKFYLFDTKSSQTTNTESRTCLLQKCVHLEKSIISSNLQELRLSILEHPEINSIPVMTEIIAAFLNGVTGSKTVKSFKIDLDTRNNSPPLPDGILEHLFQDNKTLQELYLKLPNHFISSTLNITEINAPLTTLEIDEGFILLTFEQSKIAMALLPHIKGLKHLRLMLHYTTYSPCYLLQLNPDLQYLSLQLQTFDSVIELFNSLTNNTTLLGLKLEMPLFDSAICSDHNLIKAIIGKSLGNLLEQNKVLQHLEILELRMLILPTLTSFFLPIALRNIPDLFLYFLNEGLVHNMSLKHLTMPFKVQNNEEVKLFCDTLSQRNNLTELQLYMDIKNNDIANSFFTVDGLLHFTNVICSLKSLRILKVKFQCSLHYSLFMSEDQPRVKECAKKLLNAVVFHPSLEYANLEVSGYWNIFEDQLKQVIKTYEEQTQKAPFHIEITHC